MLDSSNLKEFVDDNFKFDENERKFSERLENTVGQFLLFPLYFQNNCAADT